MTLSLAARCRRTGQFGVVIASSSPAVAARCARVRAGAGAACSQNITDPRLAPRLLDALATGRSAADALATVVAGEPTIAFRQLTCIGAAGEPAAYSGERTLGTHAIALGTDSVAAGNLLRDPRVPAAMVVAFEGRPDEPLGDRLVAALVAGLAAGGEAGPVHSAGLLIAGEVEWPIADLRVDWSDDPAGELARLWALWRPQMADYVTRALDPASSPAYGVPGDERR